MNRPIVVVAWLILVGWLLIGSVVFDSPEDNSDAAYSR